MRKIISLILAVLMVSMMIPAMALAEDSATPVDYAGLVAGETFTVTVENLTSATATISVNTQLFSIDGEASATVDVVEGVATVDVTVNAEVPAVVEASRIKIEAGDAVSYQVASIADALLGDINGTGVVDGADVYALLVYSIDSTGADVSKMNCVGDINGTNVADGADVYALLTYSIDTTNNPYNLNEAYAGGNAAIEVVDPFEGSDTPVEPEAIATPANIYAYAQNGKIYYTFDAVENAASYDITIGEEVINVADATGSIDFAYTEGMTLTVTAIAAEGYADSTASEAITVIAADASGALATWLEENGLTDVAITVHEIK